MTSLALQTIVPVKDTGLICSDVSVYDLSVEVLKEVKIMVAIVK